MASCLIDPRRRFQVVNFSWVFNPVHSLVIERRCGFRPRQSLRPDGDQSAAVGVQTRCALRVETFRLGLGRNRIAPLRLSRFACKQAPTFPAPTEGVSAASGTQGFCGAETWFTCATVAGGKPLKYVEEAWL